MHKDNCQLMVGSGPATGFVGHKFLQKHRIIRKKNFWILILKKTINHPGWTQFPKAETGDGLDTIGKYFHNPALFKLSDILEFLRRRAMLLLFGLRENFCILSVAFFNFASSLVIVRIVISRSSFSAWRACWSCLFSRMLSSISEIISMLSSI